MAVETQAVPRTNGQAAAAPRQRREREQELLVWPDLVFVEFICAVVFTITFVILASVIDSPLLNQANPNITPNPSKAAWYLVALQELLLHMNAALGGVIAPTFALGMLAILPYVDRSNDGQGVWFGTPNAVKITLFSAAFATVFSCGLVLYDQQRHVNVTENIVQHWDKDWQWPETLVAFRNVRAIQTQWHWHINVPDSTQLGSGEHDGQLDWPQDFTHVPMPFNGTSGPEWMRWDKPDWMPGWMQALYWYDLNMNTPAFVVEILIPVTVMVVLPLIMLLMLWLFGWLHSMRDVAIAVFSGMMTVYFVLTIIGMAFRGAGQDLVLPWDVPKID